MSKLESSNEFQYSKVPTHDNEKEKEKIDIPSTYGYGIRHIQLVIFFTCLAMSFIARGHLGVTLVAMTTNQTTKEVEPYVVNNTSVFDNGNNSLIEDLNSTVYNVNNTIVDEINVTIGFNETNESWSIYRTYNWPKPIQEMVLTAFFLGYLLMTFPIALVCQRWGGKVPLQWSMIVNGIVSILTPWLVLWGGWKAMCCCRVVQGLAQSGTYPGIQTLLAQWVPINERATLSGYVYTGNLLGNVIGFQLSGLVADAWGWPAVYWTVGLMCFLTGALLTVFGESSPRFHKKISIEEKNYIMGHSDTGIVQKRPAPWKAILTSKPVWANLATQVGSALSFIFFLTQVPSYIHYILGIDVKSSGLLSSLPYLSSIFTSLSYGAISDYFTNRNIISLKNARRTFNSISQLGVATSLICASYASSTTSVVICFVLSMSFQTALHAGWMVNHIDLSPNYSGTIMALGNSLSNILVLIMPVLVSNIVIDVTNVYQWRIMLYLIAAIALLPDLIFVIFMSADVQPWNDGECVESEEINDVKLEAIKKKEAKQYINK